MSHAQNIIFVTGTDTGVGKTLLTALLLCFLRRRGYRALAMKPFCTGPRTDVEVLRDCQDGELSSEEINPFHFKAPVAPWVAARLEHRSIPQRRARECVERIATRCDWLLVEGCGGVMVPLGRDFFVADWIAAFKSPVLLVASQKLGVINHTLLSVRALASLGVDRIQPVLMRQQVSDESCGSNARILGELLARARPVEVPHFGGNPLDPRALRSGSKKMEKVLALLWSSVTFSLARRQPIGNGLECI